MEWMSVCRNRDTSNQDCKRRMRMRCGVVFRFVSWMGTGMGTCLLRCLGTLSDDVLLRTEGTLFGDHVRLIFRVWIYSPVYSILNTLKEDFYKSFMVHVL